MSSTGDLTRFDTDDIAEAGNGDYHRADSGDELAGVLSESSRALAEEYREWWHWRNEGVGGTRVDGNTMLSEVDDMSSAAISVSDGVSVTERVALHRVRDDLGERSDLGNEQLAELGRQVNDRWRGLSDHLRTEFNAIRDDVRAVADDRIDDVREDTRREHDRLRDEQDELR